MRLDVFLYKNGYANSRNKANEMISGGDVFVDEINIFKPSFTMDLEESYKIEVGNAYVSRSALKLKEFLTDKKELVANRLCLDIGSSKGGFVEVLLEFGATHVDAVDVGSNQFDENLKKSKNITIFENMDIRNFKSDKKYDIITCDVSFISLTNILSSIIEFAKSDIVLLFKPQFEVGKDIKRDKLGVVTDKRAIDYALSRFIEYATSVGLIFIEQIDSSIKGKHGNEEFFLRFKIS
jgi:23S rRNA (cytidine1920-2'-O)/16S rRNA (cytidine1409-2'-O)-methyltransferase